MRQLPVPLLLALLASAGCTQSEPPATAEASQAVDNPRWDGVTLRYACNAKDNAVFIRGSAPRTFTVCVEKDTEDEATAVDCSNGAGWTALQEEAKRLSEADCTSRKPEAFCEHCKSGDECGDPTITGDCKFDDRSMTGQCADKGVEKKGDKWCKRCEWTGSALAKGDFTYKCGTVDCSQ